MVGGQWMCKGSKSTEVNIVASQWACQLLRKRSNWDSNWSFDFVRKAPPIGGKFIVTKWIHSSTVKSKLNSTDKTWPYHKTS